MDPAIPYGKIPYDPARYLAIKFTYWSRIAGAPLVVTGEGDIGLCGGIMRGIEFIDVFGKKRTPTISQVSFSNGSYDASVPLACRDPNRILTGQLFQFPHSDFHTVVFDFGTPRDIREIRTNAPLSNVQAGASAGDTDLRSRPQKIWRLNTINEPAKALQQWVAGGYNPSDANALFDRSRRVTKIGNPGYPAVDVLRVRDRQWLVAFEQFPDIGSSSWSVAEVTPIGAVNTPSVFGGARVVQGALANDVLKLFDGGSGQQVSLPFQIPRNVFDPDGGLPNNSLFWFQGASLSGVTVRVGTVIGNGYPGKIRAYRSDDGGRNYVKVHEGDSGAWVTNAEKTFNW